MINNFSLINIYEKPKQYSKLSSQMLYGEKFKILENRGHWLKIKTNYEMGKIRVLRIIQKEKLLELSIKNETMERKNKK